MKIGKNVVKLAVAHALMLALVTLPTSTFATHSWAGYHWARTSNPFTVKLGDTVTSAWDSYLATASSDWTQSTVMDTQVVAGNGTSPRKCSPSSGRVEICNEKYGQNGWLGIASIWANGSHITQGTVKMNDTYYSMAKYNTPSWRRMVMCQEIGHTFGLDHQDENFNNTNLGTCMDYTNDPSGTAGTNGSLNNEHPNKHDYDMLVSIYNHTDLTSTILSGTSGQLGSNIDTNDPRNWGNAVAADNAGNTIMFERDLGHDQRLFTFVVWVRDIPGRPE